MTTVRISDFSSFTLTVDGELVIDNVNLEDMLATIDTDELLDSIDAFAILNKANEITNFPEDTDEL